MVIVSGGDRVFIGHHRLNPRVRADPVAHLLTHKATIDIK